MHSHPEAIVHAAKDVLPQEEWEFAEDVAGRREALER
jgi:hypothetical protein